MSAKRVDDDVPPLLADPQLLRHRRRNEIQAIRLGIRLLQEQIASLQMQDARLTCEALLSSVQTLEQLEQSGSP